MPDNHDFCRTRLDLPYPEIKVADCNPDYALAMLSNVGSGNSEMTAVSLYFYNSVILNPDYANFARCFHEISVVEMHHLDIYARLAFLMGVDPRLWTMENRQMVYWTPGYNQYPYQVRDVICNSIRGEEEAIRKYKKQAETIRDPNIVAILERIILDEKTHVEIFYKMLDMIN